MNKTEKEHLRQLLNNKFGTGPKFLAQFLIETEKINESAIKAGYKEKRLEFEILLNEYKTQLESSSYASSRDDQSPILNKQSKKNAENALFQKFKTPLVNKTNGIVKQSKLADILKDEVNLPEKTNRKRSAVAADISVLHTNSSDHEDEEEDDKNLKKSLFKTEVETETKSKKTKKGSKKKTEIKNEEQVDQAKETKKNPSKKSKLNDSEDQGSDDKPAKKGAKKKKNAKTSDVEADQEDTSKKSSKKTKKGKKTKTGNDSNDNQTEPKTPGVDNTKQKTRLELLQSTVKKTIKKRPMTRAAKAAADKASIVKPPSTLKKVNKFEYSVAKQAVTNDTKTPFRNKVITNLVASAAKIKPNFRTSIDERKARTSQAKLQAKRKSVKKAQAILNSIHHERKLSSNFANNTKVINVLTEDEDQDERDDKFNIKPSRMSNEIERAVIEKLLKSSSPKVIVSKIPTMMVNTNTISAAKLTAYADNQQKRLTKDFLNSASIQQNYRVLSKITTPMKTNQTASSQNRASFTKFLERNTPSKLTRTELEEKQKAELAMKDSKEKERLAQLEKQKQQQLEDKKKKREEKMKKINELKLKTQQELEKKQREQQLQMTASKPPTSSSCLNLKQINSNSVQIPTSCSSSNLSTLGKKPTQTTTQSKPLYGLDQNDLSTFGAELNNFKQIKENLKSIGMASKDCFKENQKNMCETTYLLNSPSKQASLKSAFTNYAVTPLQPPKLKNQDNYDVSDLRSEDETDDEEEPSKPVPDWARDPHLVNKVKQQSMSMYNFTRLFKTATQSEIILDDIFKIKRKKFNQRSSSACWNSSPIWKGNGITGEESFWQFKKQY